jgi:hypothetical protein
MTYTGQKRHEGNVLKRTLDCPVEPAPSFVTNANASALLSSYGSSRYKLYDVLR